MSNSEINKYSNLQTFLLVTLRIIIGWYFLYEGLIKLANPDWSSFGYLMDSKGIFKDTYRYIALNADVLTVVDWLNKWGLTLIGFGLITGLLTQYALFCGMIILITYFFSHPALANVTYALPQEGSYLWVNKTLIEIFIMAVLLVFPTSHIFGIDRLISKATKK